MTRTLVIETATAACSVALIEDGRVIDARHDVVGRGHAERLIPMIASLIDGGRADRIAVDVGPGSFTGVRVGIAAARGLALGWGGTVRGFSSVALVAAAALARKPLQRIAVVLEAGHGEVFMQMFDASLSPIDAVVSLPPMVAMTAIGTIPAVGNGVKRLAGVSADAAADLTEALPDARDWTLLPALLADLDPRPLYGRAPDAKLPG
ncbi:tRNA (adenosine(37)-N6)-threonylcarbamoyltransferase complex dimerization subunit type 1 TsaB [Sphingomonas mollis]|uniref:tRNA (Adenosine(37)-N6)-threonylcarbamoyltransferase complex dimerization subunit type 1 TsaB n=1 Tax=Sphingomonas mollis TaxID=2795726 RepID=A0ABS0XKL3_9SPHN|nr:tRNA (adenosine(37)-N6)-threonylcarbamoyltransferase complex dimerization subunit type 1 TsaB [Sphingomonas sp. BT553]MBJ6120580.1 tRNA (adenosine(37)-N6)-threonylcarbamoyltransferase complex dimerization subunit type 1 TsaB [Sphingomonas sp. BT553]